MRKTMKKDGLIFLSKNCLKNKTGELPLLANTDNNMNNTKKIHELHCPSKKLHFPCLKHDLGKLSIKVVTVTDLKFI